MGKQAIGPPLSKLVGKQERCVPRGLGWRGARVADASVDPMKGGLGGHACTEGMHRGHAQRASLGGAQRSTLEADAAARPRAGGRGGQVGVAHSDENSTLKANAAARPPAGGRLRTTRCTACRWCGTWCRTARCGWAVGRLGSWAVGWLAVGCQSGGQSAGGRLGGWLGGPVSQAGDSPGQPPTPLPTQNSIPTAGSLPCHSRVV